jgi:hypothetical protein
MREMKNSLDVRERVTGGGRWWHLVQHQKQSWWWRCSRRTVVINSTAYGGGGEVYLSAWLSVCLAVRLPFFVFVYLFVVRLLSV